MLAQQGKTDVTERAQTEGPAGEGAKEREKKEGAKEGEARRVHR